MTLTLSEQNARIIASSMPLMTAGRGDMEAAMVRYMARNGPYDPSKGRHEVTTTAIFDMLFDGAGRIVDPATGGRDAQHGARHRRLAIGGEHYSSFGDGLGPVMKDALGSDATQPILSAWSDAYWAITRAVTAEPIAIAA